MRVITSADDIKYHALGNVTSSLKQYIYPISIYLITQDLACLAWPIVALQLVRYPQSSNPTINQARQSHPGGFLLLIVDQQHAIATHLLSSCIRFRSMFFRCSGCFLTSSISSYDTCVVAGQAYWGCTLLFFRFCITHNARVVDKENTLD
jgi:hypothetical protein